MSPSTAFLYTVTKDRVFFKFAIKFRCYIEYDIASYDKFIIFNIQYFTSVAIIADEYAFNDFFFLSFLLSINVWPFVIPKFKYFVLPYFICNEASVGDKFNICSN